MSDNKIDDKESKQFYNNESEMADISDGVFVLNSIVKNKILELARKMKDSKDENK